MVFIKTTLRCILNVKNGSQGSWFWRLNCSFAWFHCQAWIWPENQNQTKSLERKKPKVSANSILQLPRAAVCTGRKCSPPAGSKVVQRIKRTAAWPQEVPCVWQHEHSLHLINHLSVCRDRRQDQARSLRLSPLLSLSLPLSPQPSF